VENSLIFLKNALIFKIHALAYNEHNSKNYISYKIKPQLNLCVLSWVLSLSILAEVPYAFFVSYKLIALLMLT
jgi:hypothetical protein